MKVKEEHEKADLKLNIHKTKIMASGHHIERLLLSHERCQDSWPPEERNSVWGQWRGLITQSFFVTKHIEV